VLRRVFAVGAMLSAFYTVYTVPVHAQYAATTTVSLTVCGDGVVGGNELCDDGSNTGAYGSSIATRNCNPICAAYGPYCGDSVTQVFYGEECDDGNNTAGDLCDATCQNESDPVVEGGGGGSSGNAGGGGGRSSGTGYDGIEGASDDGSIEFEGETSVLVRGVAYPGATITMLRDGEIDRVFEADGSANFEVRLSEQTPGITTLGFWAVDRLGLQSITYAATFQVIQNAVTTLSGIYIPPTITIDREKVPPGESATFSGSAAPDTTVQLFTDSIEQPYTTLASGGGEWKYVLDTTPLAAETFHTTKANYIDAENADMKSGFSQILSYYVGVNDVDSNLTADLNNDGAVNLQDFSILLFNWNASGGGADIDQDGAVGLADFSIMLFYWTG